MVLFAPLFGVIALLVIADTGLPGLFRWNVVGVRGKYLTSHKHRTMRLSGDSSG